MSLLFAFQHEFFIWERREPWGSPCREARWLWGGRWHLQSGPAHWQALHSTPVTVWERHKQNCPKGGEGTMLSVKWTWIPLLSQVVTRHSFSYVYIRFVSKLQEEILSRRGFCLLQRLPRWMAWRSASAIWSLSSWPVPMSMCSVYLERL